MIKLDDEAMRAYNIKNKIKVLPKACAASSAKFDWRSFGKVSPVKDQEVAEVAGHFPQLLPMNPATLLLII